MEVPDKTKSHQCLRRAITESVYAVDIYTSQRTEYRPGTQR